jgi:peroxiredoxin Q/BCP
MRWPLHALLLLLALPSQLTAQKKGPPTAVLVRGPEVGQRAPDFSLPGATMESIGTEPFVLSRTLGQVVVLAFYPRDFTRTCTAEWQGLAAQRETLFGPEVTVVGISIDSLETHQRFAASLALPFMLLSDPAQQVARKYGAAGDDGVNRRAIYVIGKDGKVAWRDTQFNAIDPREYEVLGRAVAEARR